MNSSFVDSSIGGVAGKLPYNHLVFKGEDPRSNLVGTCFQVLCVLLDFQGGHARDAITGSGVNQGYSPTARTNAFRYFLAKLVSITCATETLGTSLRLIFDLSIESRTSNSSLTVF